MNGVEALRSANNAAHQWYQGTIGDVDESHTNYMPAGLAHPIGETALHIVQAEDYVIAKMVGGGQMLWEKDGWGAKLGLPDVTRQSQETARTCTCNVADLAEY